MNRMHLGINVNGEGQILSVGYYKNIPGSVIAVPDIPRTESGTPDDVGRYRWDANTSSYVLVEEWSAEVDAEMPAEQTV